MLSILFVVLMLASVGALNATSPGFFNKYVIINHEVFIGESFTLSSADYEALESVKGAKDFVNSHFAETIIKNNVILRATKLGHFVGKGKNVFVKLDIVAPAPKPVNDDVLTPQPLSRSIFQKN